MRMFCLSAADARSEAIWSAFRELLEQFARSSGEISCDQIREGVRTEQLQLWGLQDGDGVHLVVCTELSATPKGPICTLRMAVGSAPVPFQERLLNEIGTWAKGLGCVRVRLVGRKGWLKRFPRFRRTAIVAEWVL